MGIGRRTAREWCAPRHRGHRVVIAAALVALLALAACSDSPAAPLETTVLRLCATFDWFAYRNEGGEWMRVAGSAGTYEFAATERLAIAYARSSTANTSSDLRVNFLTAAQAAGVYGCGATTIPPSGTVSGTVGGLAGDDYADVTYGASSSTARSTSPSILLYAYTGATDLVATSVAPVRAPDHADRLIIRRAQSYAAGSSIALDFSSNEALAPAENVLTWNSAGAHVQVNYRTPSGNNLVLQSTVVGAAAQRSPLYSIPTARQVAGDVHELFLGSGQRLVMLYYREARDRSLTLGPPASPPTFTTLATTPYRRVRVEVPAQSEYDASVSVLFQQLGSLVGMVATREYFGGTPQTWSLSVPDLRGVAGFDATVGLQAGRFDWTINVSSRPYLFAPLQATDGHVNRFATVAGQQQ